MRKALAVATALVSLGLLASAAAKFEKAGPFSGEASEKIKAALAPEGYRVYLPNTLECCQVWLASKVAENKKPESAATYPKFSRSEFLGVITFPKGGVDFRGQSIRPGSYAMRYELIPNDGNHMGVAPNPDFVLLTPLSADSDPDANYTLDELVKLSSQAAGSSHPAAFEMMPPVEGVVPSVTQTDDGWIVFTGNVTTDSGATVPVSIVVKGSAQ